jgi:hypothetical protein
MNEQTKPESPRHSPTTVLADKLLVVSVTEALSEASDRARVIMVASWIDYVLELKLKVFFGRGSSRAKSRLFGVDGPFGSLSAKAAAAFCAGWIDKDVYHDIEVVRKIRNSFAHTFQGISLDSPKIRERVESLIVPRRKYSDWGHLRASATRHGSVVIYCRDKPEEAREQLMIPRAFTFQMAAPVLVSVLLANLDIPWTDDSGTPFRVVLPKYMEANQEESGEGRGER